MPALGPPIEIKLLTCGTILVTKNNNKKNDKINNVNNKISILIKFLLEVLHHKTL